MRALAAACLAAALLAGCGSGDSKPQTGTSVETVGPLTPENAPHARSGTDTAESEPAPKPAGPRKPDIVQNRIPFPDSRKQEMAKYSERHYGDDSFELVDPKVIVEHFSVTPTAQGVYDTFAADKPDVELHELPQVCSHFVVDNDGTIDQLVPLSIRCRHTVGLNDVAIGIEHVGSSDAEVLGNAAQMKASLALTRWLACRYGISRKDVIGHAESLSSPYHHENVPALRSQTHDDMQHASMERYRRRLGPLKC